MLVIQTFVFTNSLLNTLQRGDSITELKEQLDQIKSSMSFIYWTEPVYCCDFWIACLLTPFLQMLNKIKLPETSKLKNVVKCDVKMNFKNY